MQTLQYITVDKTEWGGGEWAYEPDKLQWRDEATGLPCLINRGPSGALCGYVGVSPGHPAFGADYNDVDVRVHGGLTFAGPCHPGVNESSGICHVPEAGESDHVYWLGFDCCHAWDVSPAYKRFYEDFDKEHPEYAGLRRMDETYRTVDYVKEEVRGLAAQLSQQRFLLSAPRPAGSPAPDSLGRSG